MRKAFKASRLIGLLALALGLTAAFSATAAQAEPGAYWLVNGADIGSSLLPSVNAKDDSLHTTLLTTVGKTPLEILCLEISFKGAKLHELGRATGRIHYNNCVTILNKNGIAVGNCKPHSPGDAAGLILTEPLEGLIKLHKLGAGEPKENDELLELKPVPPATAFVKIQLGALCAVGNEFEITGKAFLKDCKKEGLVDLKEHLFEEGPLTELKFGTNPATIDGSAWGFLTGVHEGMTFAGHAK